MSRGRNTRRQDEDESYDEKSEQRSSNSRRPAKEDKVEDKARVEDNDAPAIEPVEVAVQNKSPRKEAASTDAENTLTPSTEKPNTKKSVAEKEKAPTKPKKKAKPKADATATTQEEAATDDLFSTVEAESDSASPSEAAKPEKRVSTAKKAAVKRVAKADLSTARSAPVEKAKTVKKKPSSPPTRHRLEKYDFSQAAKAKSAPKEDRVKGNEDGAGGSDKEDSSS